MIHEYPLNKFSGSAQSTITVSSCGQYGGLKISDGKLHTCTQR